MNDRIRQKCKADLRRSSLYVMVTLEVSEAKCVFFIPKDEVERYKTQYGNRLMVWEMEDKK